jgi:hypothetical protein
MPIDTKTSVMNGIKVYLFPTLVTILAMMIWHDVTELRSDVKSLLAQSNVDKTKIDNLEKDVKMLEQAAITKKIAADFEIVQPVSYDKYFKHEEIFDIKKHLKMI